MNQLIVSQSLTMGSREVAELTGKQHKHVLDDVRKMFHQLEINSADFSAQYKDSSGKLNREFNLKKRECLILVSGYNLKLRAAIVDRWQELESQQAPKLPATYLEALEHLVEKERLLLEQAPKVSFVDKCVERSTLLTASQVGQKHKLSAIKLNRFLDELGGVYNKGVKRGRVFCQSFIDKGYGELKQTELGHSQALFTTLGEQWVNEKLISEGVV